MRALMYKNFFWLFILFTTALAAQAPVMEWHKGYGTDNGEHIHEIMQTNDGGYIGIGQTDEGRESGSDILVVKLDANGEFMWQRIIGTDNKYDTGICVEEADDGYCYYNEYKIPEKLYHEVMAVDVLHATERASLLDEALLVNL